MRDRELAQHRDEFRRLVLNREAGRSKCSANRVFDELQRLRIIGQAESADLHGVAGIGRPERDSRHVLQRG